MNENEGSKNKKCYERAQQIINSLIELHGKRLQHIMIVEIEYDSQNCLFTD